VNGLFHFLDVLIYGTIALVVITMAFAVVVSCLPRENPLKEGLTSLVHHLGWTATAAVVSIPVNGVFDSMGLGEVWDVIVIAGLCVYWFQFFKHQYAAVSARSRAGEVRVVNGTWLDRHE
jgi:hypothetical protein